MNPINKENDQKWVLKAKTRLEELRSGKVISIPGDVLFKKIDLDHAFFYFFMIEGIQGKNVDKVENIRFYSSDDSAVAKA